MADNGYVLSNLLGEMNNCELDPFRLNSSFKTDIDCDTTPIDPFSLNSFKEELQECSKERFDYTLKSPVSTFSKKGEENIAYLNKGYEYELMSSCAGDMQSGLRIKSTIYLRFQERRLQGNEKEQFEEWQNQNNNQRCLEVETKSAINVESALNDPSFGNIVHVTWNPASDCSVFLKVNCVSADFTKRKHGGEKGVPLLLQVDTYTISANDTLSHLLSSACIVKIFQVKGAERKHRNDAKMLTKLTEEEKSKLRTPSEVTQLMTIPMMDDNRDTFNNSGYTADCSRISDNYSDTESEVNSPKKPCIGTHNERTACSDALTSQSSVPETIRWLRANRFGNHLNTFSNYSGFDLLRLSRQDLKDLIGVTDGIRLHNALQNKSLSTKICIYIMLEGSKNSLYQAIYLEMLAYYELVSKVCITFNIDPSSIIGCQKSGPKGINICVTDEVVSHMENDSCYICSLLPTEHGDAFIMSLR